MHQTKTMHWCLYTWVRTDMTADVGRWTWTIREQFVNPWWAVRPMREWHVTCANYAWAGRSMITWITRDNTLTTARLLRDSLNTWTSHELAFLQCEQFVNNACQCVAWRVSACIVDSHGTHWYAPSAVFTPISSSVHTWFTQVARTWMRAEFFNISKFSLRHSTHPRTVHTFLMLVHEDFNHWHAEVRAIAGTKIVQVSVWHNNSQLFSNYYN